MSDERKRFMFDFLADELRDIGAGYTGPKVPGERLKATIESMALTDKRLSSVSFTGDTRDGSFVIEASTQDRGLVVEWANAGLIDDPASVGLVQIGGTWMWPPVVLSTPGPEEAP